MRKNKTRRNDRIIIIIFKSLVLSFLLFFVDYFEIINSLDFKSFNSLMIIYFFVFLIIKIFDVGVLNTLLFKFYNFIDDIFLTFAISTLLNFLIIKLGFLKFLNHNFSQSFVLYMFIFFLFLIIVRYIFIEVCNKIFEYKNKQNSFANINDLLTLYKNDFKKEDIDRKVVILEERQVNYDLLDRDIIENELYNYIANSKFNRKLTVGIVGKWGVGKSSILDKTLLRIEEDDKYIIIRNFDPWRYESKDALLRGFFDIFMENAGLRFSAIKLDIEYKKLKNILITGSKKLPLLDLLLYDNMQINLKTNEIIEKYLKTENKKIVFVIDNIDRASADNVRFLFNLINNVFNFSNIIYVLLYDNDIINEIMDKKTDRKFIDKVIDYELYVPELTKFHKSDILTKILKNIYSKYCERDIYEIINKDLIIELSSYITDIRDMKKYLNYIIPKITFLNTSLNIEDLIRLHIIKKQNIRLYYDIQFNCADYVKYGLEYCENYKYEYVFNKDQREIRMENRNKKFSKGSEYAEFEDIVNKLFPLPNYSDDECDQSIKDNRIFHGKNFDMYFTEFDKGFIEINSKIKKFVSDINLTENATAAEKIIRALFSDNESSYFPIMLETLLIYIDEIKDTSISYINEYLYKRLNDFDSKWVPFNFSSKERAIIFIGRTLIKMSEKDRVDFINNLVKNYSQINVFSKILYWLSSKKHMYEGVEKSIYQNIIDSYVKTVKLILKNPQKINLYSNKYYSRQNIFGLYIKNDSTKDDIIIYVEKVAKSSNITRVLGDIISVSSTGLEYIYKFETKNINKLISSEKLDSLVRKVNYKNLNSEQKFVIDVYKAYKASKSEIKEFVFSEEKNLTNL